MKKYLFGLLAITAAVVLVSFTTDKKANNVVNPYYWEFVGDDPLDIADYTRFTVDPANEYAALGCTSGSVQCGIITNTLTPTLSDDGNGTVAETGGVTSSDKEP